MTHLHPTIAQALAPFAPAAVGKSLTPAAQFTAALDRGYQPSDAELADLMYALHLSVIGLPLMLWMDRSFEDMGDSVHWAAAKAAIDPRGKAA